MNDQVIKRRLSVWSGKEEERVGAPFHFPDSASVLLFFNIKKEKVNIIRNSL